MGEVPAIESELVDAARQAREEAYAPYSGYKVGAAVLDSTGRVWTGANVENVSYGATICAERVAIGKMVTAGARKIEMIALVTEDGATPCGICRQSLLEFSPDPSAVKVIAATLDRRICEFSLAGLLPSGFKSEMVRRTEA